MDLRLESITKRFGERTAVDNFRLTAAEAEFVVLLGPSGCGKSTLLRIIAGLEMPDSGTVRMGGREITHLAPRDRDIAMVFQNYALYPHMTVAENVGYPLRIRKRPPAETSNEVARIAATLGIAHLLDQLPRQLSGGERQRVALARAIVRRPRAFLMDEPLSNLDARLRVEMRAELKHLQHELGTITLYVTHDQAEAMTLAHRIAVVKDGRLQQFDTPSNVYHRPANLFVAGFLGSPSMNLLAGSVVSGEFVRSGLRFPLEPAQQAAIGARTELTLGARPEDVEFSLVERPGWLPARVYVTEEMGNETFVRLSADSAHLTARVPADTPVDFDQRVWFHLRADKLHLFDSANTEAIR
jgi:multiple sugar transport system ATP-binding protein